MYNMVIHITQQLISNFAIVTAFLFLASQVIYKKQNYEDKVSLYTKLHIGFTSGLLGIVLMIFTVQFEDSILDYRQLAVIVAALFGGVYASIVTGLIIFFMRLFAFGAISTPSVIAASNIIVIAIVIGVICTKNLSYWKKWMYSLIVCNLFTSIVFCINQGSKGITPALIYILMMTVGGIITAYLTLFLIKSKLHSIKIEKAATFDFLTELSNHRAFDDVFNTSLQKAIEKNEILSLMLLDIDHFKKINDTYGHQNGDTVLKQLGKLLKDTSRSFDVVSRIGGEEFSVLLYDCPHKHALIIGERFRIAVRDHDFMLNSGQSIKLTVSVGVSTYPDTLEDITEQADKALYKAKSNGRNIVCSNQFSM
jgi:diguanylate cyclase